MDSQKRLMLALALSFVLMLLYSLLTPQHPPEVAAVADGGQTSAAVAEAAALDAGSPAPVNQVAQPSIAAPPTGAPPPEPKTVRFERKDVQFEASSKGAALLKAAFRGEK